MGIFEDLTGRQFGKLTVISRAENAKDGSAQWYCQCECGKPELVVAKGTALRAGHKKTCGCYTKLIDLTGMTFGRLTVVGRTPSKSKATKWNCSCSCGNPNLIAVNADKLTRGISQSCGCHEREDNSRKNKSYNSFINCGEYVIGLTSSGTQFYVDFDDYERIKDICWHESGTGYISGKAGDGKEVLMHRFIMGAKDGEIVDHINHCIQDNRKSNLRIASYIENSRNRRLHSRNQSGVTGVSWFARDKKWRASITIDYKGYNLGHFDTFEEAVAARKAAEEKYFGEYSYENSMAAVSVPAVY